MLERMLSLGFERLRVVTRWSPELGAMKSDPPLERRGVRRFHDRMAARSFVERVLRAPGGASQLRLLVRDLSPAPFRSSEDDQEIADRVATLLYSGALALIEVKRDRLDEAAVEGAKVEPVAPQVVEETSWVAFQIKDDESGDPVGNVKVGIKLPKAAKSPRTIPASGSLEFDPCPSGSCELDADFAGHDVGTTLEVIGWGEPSLKEGRGVPFPNPRKRPYALARVVAHRVSSHDTLKSIAEAAGLTWEKLAQFNFGTDDPKKVNQALHSQVGCRKKTHDRQNYVFSDHDDPGLVYVPHKIDFRSLRTGQTHTLRVRKIFRPQRPFLFSY